MAPVQFGLLLLVMLLMVVVVGVNGQSRGSEWNGKYAGKPGYTSYSADDNLYGLSNDYVRTSYHYQCTGCSCPVGSNLELICTGSSIRVYQRTLGEVNATSFTDPTIVTSIDIRYGTLETIYISHIRDGTLESSIYYNKTGAFDELVNLETLIIQSTAVKDFPDISNTNVRILDLAANELDFFVANWSRQALPPALTHVSLRENAIHWVPNRAFSNTNIVILSFSNNEIFEFPSSAVEDMPSLLYLGLDGNELRTISRNHLSPLVNSQIQHLNLHTNQIYAVEQNALSQLRNLTILELQNNLLNTGTLGTQILHDMPALLHLDVSSNAIQVLKEETITDMPNLIRLRLNSNAMEAIYFDAFRNINDSLAELDVSSNKLITFPHQVLSQHEYANLEVIHASSNEISNVVEFGREAFPLHMTSQHEVLNVSYVPFSTVPNMLELYLKSNRITHLETNDFCEMSILKKLYLDSNLLTEDTIMVDTFQCLFVLENLGLSSNAIQYVPEAVRRKIYLPSIKDLTLASNQLTFVPENAFTELDTLQTLSLQSNCILAIEDNSFPYQSLSTLRLQSNRFRFLHHNPFRNLTVLSFLNLEFNDITVIPDTAFHYDVLLNDLNLGYNDIKRILVTHFQDNPLSQGIKLENNDVAFIEDGTFDHVISARDIQLQENFLHILPLGGAFQDLAVTYDFHATNNYLTSILPGTFSHFTLRDIQLTGNKISHIYSGAFNYVSMRHLYLSGNPLNHLYPYAFNHTSTKNSGNIAMTPLGATIIPSLTFNDVSVSGSIYLQSSAVEVIDTLAFNQVSARSIELGSSQIATIEEGAFTDLVLSTNLVLSSNQLTGFSGSIFGGSSSINNWLKLDSNQLTLLPDDAFSGAYIRYMDLRHNYIVEYPASALAITGMQIIYISNNLITELPLGSFTSANSGLQQLDLSNNYIKVLQQDLFSDLTSLQTLNLRSNAISSVQPGTFDGMYSLYYLYLSDNYIQFFPAVPLGNLRQLDLSSNYIESFELNAFKLAVNLGTLNLYNNPLACECSLFITLNDSKTAIASGACSTPDLALATGVHFVASQQNTPLYFLDAAEAYFQCAGANLTADSSSEYNITVRFNAPAFLYPVIEGVLAPETPTLAPPSIDDPLNATTSRTYSVECTSTASGTLSADIVDETQIQTDFEVVFDQDDGVEPGVTYTCRISMTITNSYTSGQTYPVFITSLTSPDSVEDAGPDDYILEAVYHDFPKSNPDFYKVTSIREEAVTYMKSPYGNWLTQSDLLLASSMTDWFRYVVGTNLRYGGNLILKYDATSGKHRYWNSNYFPLDTLGYGHENQRDCYSVYHNFGFTSVVKGGMIYQGQGTITVAGGEQIWLAINKTLLFDIYVQPTDIEVPCKMVDLTPASVVGGGWIIPMSGTIDPVSGDCVITSTLDEDKVWLQLEVGNSYHFEVFHVERKPCSSQLFIETSDLEFYQDHGNVTGEPATDYFLYVSEDLHLNGVMGEADLEDDFSSTTTFGVNILKGNEARHFTLKDDTSANHALDVAPPIDPWEYVYFPGSDTPFVECLEPIVQVPEPEVSGTENFVINSQFALVTLDTSLDREVKDRYVLSLEVIDSSTSPTRTGSIVVLIQVQDVNDNCPVIVPGNLTFEPIPSLEAEPLFYVSVTDEDIQENAEVYFHRFYDVTSPPLAFKYNLSMDYYTMVYNETSQLIIHLAFLDRGTDPVRGTIYKPTVTLSNSCLLTPLFDKIPIEMAFNYTTGGVRFKIPGYRVDEYECSDLVGLTAGWIVDSQMSASSYFDITSFPARARLNTTYDATGELFGAWVAATNDLDQYWAIDFWEPYRILQVQLQGREDAEMWVETFSLQYLDPTTGNYTEYTNSTGTTVFAGATDQNTIVTTSLDPLIVTQILRVHPKSWHGSIALRIELLGCAVTEFNFYNTQCHRCIAGSYCTGDGSSLPCGSCDSEPCESNITDYSYGGYDTCMPCAEGWLCKDGLASPCPLYHYAVCENDACEESCRPCPAGFACSGGVITECRNGFFSEELSANCSLCPAGTYQNQTGQGECLNCPAGYESATAMDHCNPCPEGTYSTGDGLPCSNCVVESQCACQSEVPPCFVKNENLKVDCRNTGYDGSSFECDPCPPGFIGDGSTCLDVDECTDYSPCFNGRCINIEPGYQCLACPYGYTGYFKDGQSASTNNRVFLCDGHTNASDSLVEQICDDIDECSTKNGGCHTYAYCYNLAGSHECGPCKKGYLGSSFYGCHIDNYCLSGNNSCSEHATCIYAGPGAYRCECNDGYTGPGLECGKDTDLDGHPDQSLSTCLGLGCKRDNCPTVPNSGQEDNDGESLGDNCDPDDDNDVVTDVLDNCPYVYNPWKTDTDGDGVGDDCDNCVSVNNPEQTDTDGDSIGDECDDDIDGDGVLNVADSCPLTPNSDQTDSDGDGLGNVCDNCPDDVNTDQTDTDENGFGDVCAPVRASSNDRDGDNVPNKLDNCPFWPNPQQSDIDNDGQGDECDEDSDGDGILNINDNCILVSNIDQLDSDENEVGNACDGDSDGDSTSDTEDHCPYNPVLNDTSFWPYSVVYLDPSVVDSVTPEFKVNHEGKEVLMTQSPESDAPFILLGDTYYSDVEYSGTWYIDGDSGTDYIGFVFGYQTNWKYYIAMMKHESTNRDVCIGGIKGLQIKVVESSSGPGHNMGDATWLTDDTNNEVRLLWQDPTMYAWQHRQALRWHLIWQPSIGYINVRVADSEGVEVVNSGDLYDSTIQGGRLGLFAFNQSDVYWSHLNVRCSQPQNWALYFDGVDDYVELGEIADFNIEESFTIEVWIKRKESSIPGKQPLVCTLDSSICLYLQDDKVVGKVGQSVADGTSALPEDYWHHITLRYEYQTETLDMYINGTLSGVEGSAADAVGINITTINDTVLYLGKDRDSYFEGIIDEVRIYNRWVPETYLDNYITSFSPEWSFHQQHLTGHYTMNDYNPWNESFVEDHGIHGLHGEAFGNPLFSQDTLNFAVFELAHPMN